MEVLHRTLQRDAEELKLMSFVESRLEIALGNHQEALIKVLFVLITTNKAAHYLTGVKGNLLCSFLSFLEMFIN